MCNRSSLDRGTSGTHRRCPTLPPPSCMHPSSHPATRCWGPLSPHSPPGPGSFLRDALHLGMTGGPRGWAQAQAGCRSGPALSSAGNWGAMPLPLLQLLLSSLGGERGTGEGTPLSLQQGRALPSGYSGVSSRSRWFLLRSFASWSFDTALIHLQLHRRSSPGNECRKLAAAQSCATVPAISGEAPASSQGTHGATGAAVVGSGPTHSDHVP